VRGVLLIARRRVLHYVGWEGGVGVFGGLREAAGERSRGRWRATDSAPAGDPYAE